MEILYPRCCGLHVHKRTVVACPLVSGPEGQAAKEIRTFGTMTANLLALSDWLAAAGCTQCGHGSDRCLLETDLQSAGRPLRGAGGQCGPY